MTNKIQNKIYAIEDRGKGIFYTLLVLVFVSMGLYMTLLGGTFLGGLERQELSKQAEGLRTSIQDLEDKYLTLNNKIDVEYAKSLGFVSAVDAQYLSVKAENDSSLTLNR